MKKYVRVLFVWIMCGWLFAPSVFAQTGFNPMALTIRWELLQNQYQGKPDFLAALTITNASAGNVPATGWKLYFNLRYHSATLSSLSPALRLTNMNGELFCIQPTADFSGLKPGQSIRLEFTGTRLVKNYQDAPSGFFWLSDATPQIAIPLPPIALATPTSPNAFEIATQVFAENAAIEDIPLAQVPKILPTPVLYEETGGAFIIDRPTVIVSSDSFQTEAAYLADELGLLLGKRLSVSTNGATTKAILFRQAKLAAEAYQLQITPQHIMISAADGAGIFWGIQSLKAMLPTTVWKSTQSSLTVPAGLVSDAPRFSVRAFMLDVGRNFQPKQAILKLLDVMALYKLNVFHFHLTDDEGWRLAIPGLPELTQVGAQRGYPFQNNQRLQPAYGSGPVSGRLMGSGFYSRADFIDILQYATQRHIQVVPEIESPGHARAAVKAMEARYAAYQQRGQREEAERYRLIDPADSSRYRSAQYFTDNVMNPVLPSTYRFIEKVIDEVQRMYAEAKAPLTMIHMGGDEVPHGAWEKSPAVLAHMRQDESVKTARDLSVYFFKRVKAMLKARNLALTGWEDLVVTEPAPDKPRQVSLLSDFIQDQVQLDAWWNMYGNEDIPYRLANAGYPTVLACFDYFYFDLAHKPGFAEPGDAWIGYLDTDKLFRFIPYDYYRNNRTSVTGNPWPRGQFDQKEKLSLAGRQHIVGLKGALWSENMQADSLLEYMLLPRLLALAERAWATDPDWAREPDSTLAQQGYEKTWSMFANRLGKRELPRLDYYHGGYGYRIPGIGVQQVAGKIRVNSQFPGFPIRYTTDGREPTGQSPLYQEPIPTTGSVRFGVFTQQGRRGPTVLVDQ